MESNVLSSSIEVALDVCAKADNIKHIVALIVLWQKDRDKAQLVELLAQELETLLHE